MPERECNKCGITKDSTEYYAREGTCKKCRKIQKKKLYHGKTSDDDDADNLIQLRQDLDKLRDNMESKDANIKKLENTLQEICGKVDVLENCQLETNAQLSLLCEENVSLNAKIVVSDAEIAKLRSDVDRGCNRMDLMDENISHTVAVSEELHGMAVEMGKDIKKIQTSAIGLSGKMGYHSEMVHEMGDAYYQFIMGNATKYEVRNRLVAKGYVMYQKRDDDVD
jgi:chromosome segregation ATPase